MLTANSQKRFEFLLYYELRVFYLINVTKNNVFTRILRNVSILLTKKNLHFLFTVFVFHLYFLETVQFKMLASIPLESISNIIYIYKIFFEIPLRFRCCCRMFVDLDLLTYVLRKYFDLIQIV